MNQIWLLCLGQAVIALLLFFILCLTAAVYTRFNKPQSAAQDFETPYPSDSFEEN